MPRSRPTKSARKPADRYHHGDLPHAMLQEAVRTIQTQGVDALTLRCVGERLGVSRTALYRHFADKQALQSPRRDSECFGPRLSKRGKGEDVDAWDSMPWGLRTSSSP